VENKPGAAQLTLGIANQTLQRTPGSLAVLAGAGGGAAELVVGVPKFCQHSIKRLLYTAIGGTCEGTLGGAQWENF